MNGLKKIKSPAESFLAGSIILAFFAIAFIILTGILTKISVVNEKLNHVLFTVGKVNFTVNYLIGLIALFFVLFGWLMAFISSVVLGAKSKYAKAANYKAETSWSNSITALFVIFTALLLAYIIVIALTRSGTIENVVIASWTSTTSEQLTLEQLMGLIQIIGLLFFVISSTLSVALINRANNEKHTSNDFQNYNPF